MARTDNFGGAREQRVPDWLFGGPGRRLLLNALLREAPAAEGWTKKELERLARVGHRGLDTVLPGAVHLGLVELADGRWRPLSPDRRMADAVTTLLSVTDGLPDEEIRPLPRRAYERR